MTREEVKQILMVMSTTYTNWKPENMTNTVNVWSMIFKDYDAITIQNALMEYIQNDIKGFAPVPGQIIACIKTEVGGLLEADAWDLVTKAISNSIYNSDEEYAKLPVECQKAVGSANNLRQLAIVDIDTLQTVEKSTFMSRYRAVVSSLKKEQQRPEYIKDRLESKAVGEIETRSM